MTGTSSGGKKFAAKMLAIDPDYYKKLAAKRKRPAGGKNSRGSFKKGNKFARMGGLASRRGKANVPGVIIPKDAKTIDDIGLTFEEHGNA